MLVQTGSIRQTTREPDWKLRVVRSEFGVIASYIRELSETGSASRARAWDRAADGRAGSPVHAAT